MLGQEERIGRKVNDTLRVYMLFHCAHKQILRELRSLKICLRDREKKMSLLCQCLLVASQHLVSPF